MNIGFIGGGNMADAIIGGIIRSGLVDCGSVVVSDIAPERLTALLQKHGVRTTDSNSDVISACDTIILAVKPQTLDEISGELSAKLTGSHLVISILAGKTREAVLESLGGKTRVIRVMPNLPALVGAGVTALSETDADFQDMITAETIFRTVGTVVTVPEGQMDAITALSGSGPGFAYYILEAFIEAGQTLGIDKKSAESLAVQTFAGSIRLLTEENAEPSELKERVTSKGGTTAAGIACMEENQLKEIILKTLKSATARAAELSNPKE